MLTIFVIIIIIGLHYNGVAFLGFDNTKEFLKNHNNSSVEGEEIYIVKIISNGIAKNNSTQYLVKIENRKFYLYLKKNIDDLEYGDFLKVKGKYEEPDGKRNYGGFDYSLYLKTKRIYGIIYAESAIKYYGAHSAPLQKTYNRFICNAQKAIYDKLKLNLNKEQSSVGLGLLTGYTSFLSDEMKESFQKASLTHVLAISGEHFSFIILFITFIISKTKQKRLGQIITIIIIIIFAGITGYTGSVIRARHNGYTCNSSKFYS